MSWTKSCWLSRYRDPPCRASLSPKFRSVCLPRRCPHCRLTMHLTVQRPLVYLLCALVLLNHGLTNSQCKLQLVLSQLLSSRDSRSSGIRLSFQVFCTDGTTAGRSKLNTTNIKSNTPFITGSAWLLRPKMHGRGSRMIPQVDWISVVAPFLHCSDERSFQLFPTLRIPDLTWRSWWQNGRNHHKTMTLPFASSNSKLHAHSRAPVVNRLVLTSDVPYPAFRTITSPCWSAIGLSIDIPCNYFSSKLCSRSELRQCHFSSLVRFNACPDCRGWP